MADISKIQIESGVYDIKDTTARGDIDTINQNINTINTNITNLSNKLSLTNILKNKKVITMGDSLDITGRWGTYFINYSECDGENYGSGSAGFLSKGNTSPFENMDFNQMLNYIITNKTQSERDAIEYFILGGGINDALNNYTPTNISNAVQTFISTVKSNFVNAKLIIIPLNTFKWLKNIELERFTSIIETCKRNGVETTGDFLFWTVFTSEYNSGDSVHLTDAGYQKLAHYMLSFVNGSRNTDIQNIKFTLKANWSKLVHLGAYKKDNIVYMKGCLHYDGTLSAGTEILDFDLGNLITGSSNYNLFIPCLIYTSSQQVMSCLQIQNGTLKMGYPVNFTSLSSPYIYINTSWVVGMASDD